MMSALLTLGQCPCSGGGSSGGASGISPWLILLAFAGVWFLACSIWSKKGVLFMGKVGKLAIVVVLAITVLAVVGMKRGGASAPSPQPTAQASGSLPRLVDLGSTTCIPCKMMAPVLDELGKEYAGRMHVEFINVNENPDAGKPFGIKLIPTQVFIDASGKELWRHEGFISKQDILAKWRELGVSFAGGTAAASQPALASVIERLEPTTAPAATTMSANLNDTYPDLASSGLTFARLADLPKGTVLKVGDLTIAEKEVADEIAKAPREVQDQLKKNAFFILEQMATKALLLKEAKADADKATADVDERAFIQGYLVKLADKVKVSDEEIAEFYKNNKDAVGGAELDKVKPQIAAYLRQQKQEEMVAQHVKALGQRNIIEVSASWTKEQAGMAKDNPVDKARASGKPSLVDFGSKGCRPCDMLAPILEALKTKYDGKANVLFVSVVQDQILAARYGIDSIPVQVFFDKDGKEVFRHVGFFPQEDIEKQMANMGVK